MHLTKECALQLSECISQSVFLPYGKYSNLSLKFRDVIMEKAGYQKEFSCSSNKDMTCECDRMIDQLFSWDERRNLNFMAYIANASDPNSVADSFKYIHFPDLNALAAIGTYFYCQTIEELRELIMTPFEDLCSDVKQTVDYDECAEYMDVEYTTEELTIYLAAILSRIIEYVTGQKGSCPEKYFTTETKIICPGSVYSVDGYLNAVCKAFSDLLCIPQSACRKGFSLICELCATYGIGVTDSNNEDFTYLWCYVDKDLATFLNFCKLHPSYRSDVQKALMRACEVLKDPFCLHSQAVNDCYVDNMSGIFDGYYVTMAFSIEISFESANPTTLFARDVFAALYPEFLIETGGCMHG